MFFIPICKLLRLITINVIMQPINFTFFILSLLKNKNDIFHSVYLEEEMHFHARVQVRCTPQSYALPLKVAQRVIY